MFEIQSFVVAVFLAYYWTGFEMVEFHTLSSPINRPAYVKRPWYLRAVSALIWPYVAFINRELGWYFCCFVSYALVIAIIYSASLEYVSAAFVVLAVVVIRQIPIVSVVLNAPAALMAAVIFIPVQRIFGSQIPDGVERMTRKV